MKKIMGFTLAEVLITLAIVGVVAAMTIPTLVAKINDKVSENQIEVFSAKLLKGLNLTKTAGDMIPYDSTYEFLTNGLSKNLKMTKICDSEHIRDCVPYDKIKYEKADGTEITLDVKEIKTASKLRLNGGFVDTAAFVLADGTPVIVSYNLSCIDDPDKAYTSISEGCLAGLYDVSGTRKPNKFGVKTENGKTVYTGDIKAFNGAKIGNCSGIIGNVCVASTAKTSNDSLVEEIKEVDPEYTLPKTAGGNNDYWQVASDYCQKVHGVNVINQAQAAQIFTVLYGRPISSNWDNSVQDVYPGRATIAAAIGVNMGMGSAIWTNGSNCNNAEKAFERKIANHNASYFCYPRTDRALVICAGE